MLVKDLAGNYGAEMTYVEYRTFRRFWPEACPETPRGFSMQACPKTPHRLRCRPVNSSAPPTHHSLYNSDKLSRLAPPSELIERHYYLRNQEFSGRPHARRLFCGGDWRSSMSQVLGC
jgi:hypothetical protein